LPITSILGSALKLVQKILLHSKYFIGAQLGTLYLYPFNIAGDIHNFIIQHDMEKKFSLLIKELYRYIIEEMFDGKLDYMITDSSVVLRFRGDLKLDDFCKQRLSAVLFVVKVIYIS
jgi:hypothetical protein